MRAIRSVAIVGIMATTLAVFVYYFATHPVVRQQLGHTPPIVIVCLLLLYLAGIGALALVTLATLRLCSVRVQPGESLLLTAYSSIVNFFGPLQSGPAFRAVYLKKKHGINLKNYTTATLVYYFFYGGFSAVLLLSTWLKWWLLPLVAAGLLVAYSASRSKKVASRLQKLDLQGWYYLAIATAAQVFIVTLIYYIELRTISPGIHLAQALVYSGAANLSLFVSLTPGAIGFRESFLVFSQHLHHISNGTIVAANILDRAMYIILLLLLAAAIFATHARSRLQTDN